MLYWLLKNERTYARVVHVEYCELITRCMQIKEAFFCNKYYVNLVDSFLQDVYNHVYTYTHYTGPIYIYYPTAHMLHIMENITSHIHWVS